MHQRASQGVRTTTSNSSGASGLSIDGKEGRYDFINGVYEPMDQPHNGKPCWCARAVQSTYIFHTKGNRWVVGKRLDEGSKCYAFLNDKAGKYADPADQQQKGGETWNCPDDEGEWHADSTVSCTKVPPANDKFVQLRMSLDNELTQLGLVSTDSLKQLWKRLDYNGNGVVSLAEIDKMVVELVAGGTWPAWLNNKPALMRAYKKTILKDGDGDDWVEKKEFHALLLNVFWFNKLWQVFNAMDGDDRRMDANEFCAGMSKLGLNLSQQEAMAEFNKIDSNHGGQVLFVEFCAYIRHRVTPDSKPNFDADIISGEKCGAHLRHTLGHKSTHTHHVQKKSLAKFDQLEQTFKGVCKDNAKLRDIWHRLDFNGNKIVSLAEIDKLAVEKYPLLNHKPALMRAYKATIKAGNGDDWVQKKEFKSLLGNLIYFNKIFWMFDHVDGDKDRRLNEKEFKWCLSCLGEKMSDSEASMEFRKVDRNGGGIILFDEFCKYVTSKKCPEALTEFVD
jgi:Ca2+-binding EF-hand superfamily protein